MKKMKADWIDVEDLACLVTGLPDGAESDEVDTALFEKFEISMEQFHKVVAALLPFTIPAKSPLTDTIYHGFVNGGAFVVKAEKP